MNKAMRSFPPDLPITLFPSFREGVVTIVVPISDIYFHPCGLWSVLWLSGNFYWQRDAHQMQFYSLQSKGHYNEVLQPFRLIPRLIYYFYCCLPALCVWKRPRFLVISRCGYQCQRTSVAAPLPFMALVSFSLIETRNSEASCPLCDDCFAVFLAFLGRSPD